MNRERIAAAVVLILAGALAILIVVYAVFVLVRGRTLEPPASTTLAMAIGGVVGIIGAYLGRLRGE
jgi:hypothetical protein